MQNIRGKAVRPIDSEAYELLRSIQAYEYMSKLIKSFNLEQLKSFNFVCIFGSIIQASKQTGIARATLGRHISALEDDLSSQLFKRTKSGLILTYIGETTFQYSQTIFKLTEELSETWSRKTFHSLGMVFRKNLRIAFAKCFWVG